MRRGKEAYWDEDVLLIQNEVRRYELMPEEADDDSEDVGAALSSAPASVFDQDTLCDDFAPAS